MFGSMQMFGNSLGFIPHCSPSRVRPYSSLCPAWFFGSSLARSTRPSLGLASVPLGPAMLIWLCPVGLILSRLRPRSTFAGAMCFQRYVHKSMVWRGPCSPPLDLCWAVPPPPLPYNLCRLAGLPLKMCFFARDLY